MELELKLELSVSVGCVLVRLKGCARPDWGQPETRSLAGGLTNRLTTRLTNRLTTRLTNRLADTRTACTPAAVSMVTNQTQPESGKPGVWSYLLMSAAGSSFAVRLLAAPGAEGEGLLC